MRELAAPGADLGAAPAPAPEMTRQWEAGAGTEHEQQPSPWMQQPSAQEDGEGSSSCWGEGKDSNKGGPPTAEDPLPHTAPTSVALNGFLGEGPQDGKGPTGVTLRVESLTDKQAKRLISLLNLALVVAVVLTVLLFTMKQLVDGENYFVNQHWPFVVNAVIASLCVALACSMGCVFFYHIICSLGPSWKQWLLPSRLCRADRRRRTLLILRAVQLCAVLTNAVFYLVPNVNKWNQCWWYFWYDNNTWRHDFIFYCIRWSMWNLLFFTFVVEAHNVCPLHERKWMPRWLLRTQRRRPGDTAGDDLVVDGSWLLHAPILLLWAAIQGVLIAYTMHNLNGIGILEDYPFVYEDTWYDYEYVPSDSDFLWGMTYIFGPQSSDLWQAVLDDNRKPTVFEIFRTMTIEQYAVEGYHCVNHTISYQTYYDTAKALINDFRETYDLEPCEGNIDCSVGLYRGENCGFNTLGVTLMVLQFALLSCYFLLYVALVLRAAKDLALRPYMKYSSANVALRMQARLYLSSFFFLVLSITLLTYIDVSGCAANLITLWGFADMQVLAGTVMAIKLYLACPFADGMQRHLLRTELQQFAWVAGDEQAVRERRAKVAVVAANAAAAQQGVARWLHRVAARLPTNHGNGLKKAEVEAEQEPVFSVDITMRALYLSSAVYEQEDVGVWSLDRCLGLFDLQAHRRLEHADTHTSALVGWAPGRLVVAFRGTITTRNVLTDIKAWMSRYSPPTRRPNMEPASHGGKQRKWGGWSKKYTMFVHSGFNAAWKGLRSALLVAVDEALADGLLLPAHAGSTSQMRPPPLEVIVTGHSMGGALAILAALELKEHLTAAAAAAAAAAATGPGGGVAAISLRCYTFGAPRIGNWAFANYATSAVRDQWHVVNANDAVPKMTKMLAAYKASGERAIINLGGDVVVRPSWIEGNLQLLPGQSSVRDHLLDAGYWSTMAAVVAAQYTESKALPGGRRGVERMWEDQQLAWLLKECCGLTDHALRRGESDKVLHNRSRAPQGSKTCCCPGKSCSGGCSCGGESCFGGCGCGTGSRSLFGCCGGNRCGGAGCCGSLLGCCSGCGVTPTADNV